MNTTSNVFKGRKWTGRSAEGRANNANGGTTPLSIPEADATPQVIRIILADSEAIFRVGMSKIFAQQEDLAVVAQTETLCPDVKCSREHTSRRDSLRGWAVAEPGRRDQRGRTPRHSGREAHHGYPARRRAGNRRLSPPRCARNSGARRIPRVCWCAVFAKLRQARPGSTSKA